MKAVDLGQLMGDGAITASCLSRGARALANMGNYQRAEQLNARAVKLADSSGQPLNLFQTLSDKGFIYKLQKKYPAAVSAYEKSFDALQNADIYATEVGTAYSDASECYEAVGNFAKALATARLSAQIRDSVRSSENVRKTTELSMRYDFDKQQQSAKAQQEKRDAVAQTKQSALFMGLLLTLAVVGVVVYAYLNKQKSNNQLTAQKTELQKTLTELQSAQAQLVQSEKMASLGELTAGIAHEIQNPLNFVNNFSEVSAELIDEMESELESGNKEEVLVLAKEVKQNLGKIVHHGKRADSIVKGMLLHSRKSSGLKEPTNLNALAEEYFRLSYFGLRAKDNSFQATLETDFDASLSAVNLIPQDMGRVLLNLFNNAFYAVKEKKEHTGNGYIPKVSVSTRKLDHKVQIIVKDNGSGIPRSIVDKIFQPFFTTKPTGHGTGLGLSLSYDIVTGQHGGTLQVITEEGKGTEFVILLPVSSDA